MRLNVIYFAMFFCVLALAAILIGCGAVGQCNISPIEIEELAADSRDLDIEMATVRERMERAENELAAWQKRYEEKKGQPMLLTEKLEKLKRASGRTETEEEEEQGEFSIEELLGEQ